jgi:hypothetical protein
MPDFGGGYSMNPQVAKMKGSAAPSSDPAQPSQPQDPMADPDVQAAIQLLQQKGITPDQIVQALAPEPDMDDMSGGSDSDSGEAGDSGY